MTWIRQSSNPRYLLFVHQCKIVRQAILRRRSYRHFRFFRVAYRYICGILPLWQPFREDRCKPRYNLLVLGIVSNPYPSYCLLAESSAHCIGWLITGKLLMHQNSRVSWAMHLAWWFRLLPGFVWILFWQHCNLSVSFSTRHCLPACGLLYRLPRTGYTREAYPR